MVKEEVLRYEDDISAEEETEIKSSWLQSQNEYSWRKKSVGCQKSKRKSEIICLIRRDVHRHAFGYFVMNQAASNCGLFFSELFLRGQRRFHEKISFHKEKQ